MRICYVADGASIHTQRWINYFAHKGHEVHLICWKIMSGYDGNIRIHLLTKVAPKIWAVSQYLSFLSWIIQVRRLVRKIEPDIVDGHFITVYGFLASCSGFHPLVVSAWGSDILLQPKQNPLQRFLVRYALKKADTVICDSETVKEGLLKLGTSLSKIKKIFWGVDTEQFNPRWRNKEIKSQLKISGAPSVISLRNFKTVYNVGMLIRAIPLVLDRVPGTKFILAGDGEQRDYLKNMTISLGISDNIRFLGWIPHNQLPKYLASSDVYVSTSLSDSTSLSLQEAMACELAPVVTDLPANREWITNSKCGFLVSTNDTEALADKIVYLIRNRRVREKFGKQGRKIIEERAEYQKEMARMERVYQGLTGEIA